MRQPHSILVHILFLHHTSSQRNAKCHGAVQRHNSEYNHKIQDILTHSRLDSSIGRKRGEEDVQRGKINGKMQRNKI